MWGIIILLICAIVILAMQLNYKNHCILEILYRIQELTDYRKSYSKETVREYVNKKIELNTNATNENV